MENNTATQILDAAQAVVRNRSYSAFSYADIVEQVGIRKASIHYHFPTKDELVRQLLQRYREAFARACQQIPQSTEQWLSTLLQQGRSPSEGSDAQAQSEAQALIALLSGAQLLARTSPEPDPAFDRCVQPAMARRFS